MSTEPLFRELFAGDPAPTGPPLTGAELRDSAIEQVEQNANPDFLVRFREALEDVARTQFRFNSDPIWERYEKYQPCPSQHEPRAAGAVIRQAMRDGVIEKVKGLYWDSKFARCHGRPKQVYESRIYKRESQ